MNTFKYLFVGGAILSLSMAANVVAGDMTVRRQSNQIIIESVDAGSDDSVLIYKPVPGWLRIDGIDGSTIYGDLGVNVPLGQNTDLIIRLGDGNDAVQIDGNPLFYNVNIDLGAAGASANDRDDLYISSMAYQGSLLVSTGDDDDTVRMEGIENWNFNAFNYLQVYTGRGADSVSIDSSFHLADFTIIQTADPSSPDGSRDSLSMRSVFTEFAWLLGGQGVDEVNLNGIICDDLSLLTKGGVDYVDIDNSDLEDIHVSTGSGNDELAVRNCYGSIAILDGSTGSNDSLAYSNNQFDSLQRRNWEIINGRRQYNVTRPYYPTLGLSLR